MGFFDRMNQQPAAAAPGTAKPAEVHGDKTERIFFADLPETLDAFKALPQAELTSPFDTAALAVAAFCLFPADKELCYQMIDFLRGPHPMTGADKQFISDRFRGKDYVPRSYFEGAVPGNNYMPTEPYTITVKTGAHSYDSEGYVKLFIPSGGADDPRPVTLRCKGDKWYLWEYSSILSGIRTPAQEDPWA